MQQVKEIPVVHDHYLDDQSLNRPNSAEKSGKEIYLHSSSTRIFREEIKNPSLMTSSSSSTAQKIALRRRRKGWAEARTSE